MGFKDGLEIQKENHLKAAFFGESKTEKEQKEKWIPQTIRNWLGDFYEGDWADGKFQERFFGRTGGFDDNSLRFIGRIEGRKGLTV